MTNMLLGTRYTAGDGWFCCLSHFYRANHLHPLFWCKLIFMCRFSNAAQWITFAPVSTVATAYYGVSNAAIDWFSMVWMVVFLVCFLPCSWIFHHYPLAAIYTSCCLNVVGAWIRYIAGSNYVWALVGQTVVSMAQPLMLNAPPAVADSWFTPHERSFATAIATLSNYAGWAIGFIVPPLVVSTSDSFSTLILGESVFASLVCVCVLTTYRAAPPTAPSASAMVLREPFRQAVVNVLKNHRLCLLCICYGFVVGCSYAVSTELQQFADPFGYGQVEIGLLGLLFVSCGIISGTVMGWVLGRVRIHSWLIRCSFTFSTVFLVLFTIALQNNIKPLLYVSTGLSGAGLIGFAPIAFDAAVEESFPISEFVSACFLNTSAQLFGLVITYITAYLGNDGAWAVTAFVGAAALLSWLFYPPSTVVKRRMSELGYAQHTL
eukprot:GILJ01010361.1.p1 GENE.GILJ01010361.1~~GILJ01010361.1.p1  ORF type:complete len:434 (+),score=19.73 GILJ01010361.1:35-1336(+)